MKRFLAYLKYISLIDTLVKIWLKINAKVQFSTIQLLQSHLHDLSAGIAFYRVVSSFNFWSMSRSFLWFFWLGLSSVSSRASLSTPLPIYDPPSVCLPLTVHLVDVWNMIEAFRDNGLNTLDHNAEINVSRLETILSSIYYQLNKRLPTTHQINVEQSIGLLLNFMVATYDR